jgi:protein disulfide-isomerase A1
MKTKLIVLFLVIGMSLANTFPEEDGVLVLGENDLDQAFKTFEFILVDFYAPWCGHCKKLTPEYAKAAKSLAKDNPPLKLAKIDTTIHKSLGVRYKIEGFPTLKLFINGEPTDYTGGRTENDIVNWMRKKTGPVTKTLNNSQEVENFKNSGEVVLVLFGDNNDALNKFARLNEEFIYGECNTDECLDYFKVKKGTLVLFKKFDDGRNDLSDGLTDSNIKSFVEGNSKPLAMKFDEKTAQLVFANFNSGLFLFRDSSAANTPELERIIKQVASKTKGKLQVITTDIKQGLEIRLAEYIGVTSADLPCIKIADTRAELKKYNFQGEMNVDSIIRFVEDWESGKLKQFYRSQEIPEMQTEPVYTLVAKNFDEVVMDPTKDVLVEFYAPWCTHCKKFTPIYEELAKNLQHNPNLIIAKIDATSNEIENISIQGFPTFKFWPANNKNNPIDYNEDRTIEAFTKFLTVHGATSIKLKNDL